VAAGNDNLDACQYSPASAPDAITVAASDRLDGRDSFSNWGGCVDLFAPGVGIMSASNAGDSLYTTMSGTSMASPHVAGIAAVFLSRYPNATTAEVADAIATQATPNHIADPQTSPNRLAYSILYQPVPPIPPVPPVPFNPAVMGIINSLLLDDADTDTDTDGIPDATDNCPAIANADQIDTDGDREGNACDTDDDNDGAPDAQDAFPLDPTESVDTDGDGTGNRADLDDDNDGAPDAQDAFLLDPTESVDTDGDGIGNNADLDDDNDGVLDATDSCLLTANPDQADVCDPTPNFCLECLPSRGGWRAILQ
jgi:subtilisin family serine protease